MPPGWGRSRRRQRRRRSPVVHARRTAGAESGERHAGCDPQGICDGQHECLEFVVTEKAAIAREKPGAKEFLISQIVREAQRENVALCEIERKMLFFRKPTGRFPT